MPKQKSRQNWYIRESPSQFENQIMPRVYIRSITGSTMYQKAPNGVWKVSVVACGFSSIKIDYRMNLIYNRLICCDHTCYCVNMVTLYNVSVNLSRYTKYSLNLSPPIVGRAYTLH